MTTRKTATKAAGRSGARRTQAVAGRGRTPAAAGRRAPAAATGRATASKSASRKPAATTGRKLAPAKGRKATPSKPAPGKNKPAPGKNKPARGQQAPARGRAPGSSQRRRAATRRRPSLVRRVLSGDRVYVFVFLGVIAALVAMAVGPLQSYTAAADRVDGLTETRDALREHVDSLEERRERLHDLEEIELMARANLGLVKPGEVPFVMVTPEPDLDQVHPEGADQTSARDGPWYRRVGRWLSDLLP